MSIALLPVRKNAFHDARHPDRIVVAPLPAIHARTYHTRHLEFVQLLLRECDIFLRSASDLLRSPACVETHMQHDLAHVIVHYRLQDLVLRVVVSDAGVSQTFKADLSSQLQNISSVCHFITLPLTHSFSKPLKTLHRDTKKLRAGWLALFHLLIVF